MCWMTLGYEHDALANGIMRVKEAEKTSGGHSWGFAYASDGELHIRKEVGMIPDDMHIPVTEHAIVHTRLATRGRINGDNAHPMAIRNEEGEIVAALVHNGTWINAPDHHKYSDTWLMARVLEQMVRKMSFEDAMIELCEKVGETIIVLRRDGSSYVHSGRFHITNDRDSRVASTGYEHIPTGTLLRYTADGERVVVNEL